MDGDEDEDDDTEPLTPVTGGHGPEGTGAAGVAEGPDELPDADRSLRKRWSCTYEFARPDAALLYVACVAALAAATGVWPLVELRARRVSLRLPAGDAASALRSELLGWARRMGGRAVDRSD